jgi:hypothetical protein
LNTNSADLTFYTFESSVTNCTQTTSSSALTWSTLCTFDTFIASNVGTWFTDQTDFSFDTWNTEFTWNTDFTLWTFSTC